MLRVEMFSNKELLNSIVRWLRESNIQYSSPEVISQQLEDGTWLDWHNNKIRRENGYQDSV